MSVDFARAVVAGLRHNGVTVRFPLADWESRGNGQTSNYEGLIWHHTATGYSDTPPAVLWNGRPDLRGPLCNSSGNGDGSVSMIAAHPANHAGASGGRSMGPLPVTRTFNSRVWGHEIVYPGDKPMTAAQHRTMLILGGVISGILRRPTPEWCRGHAETSITGKWDPGYAPGKTIDLAAARRDTWAALHSPPTSEEDDLTPEQDKMLRLVYQQLAGEDATAGTFPGWPSWGGGTGERLTLVNFLRRANVETRVGRNETTAMVATLRAEVSALAKQVGELAAAVQSSGGGGVAPTPTAFEFTGTATPTP